MKKIAILFALVFTFAALTFAVGADMFNGTMVRSNNADPNLFFYNGNYYLTQTGTSRIAVFETAHVDELDTLKLSSNISYTAYYNGTVYDPTVTELFGEGASINGTWSPEIHYFSEEQFPGNSGWYMFLGLRKNTGDSSMVRMVILKSTTNSPKGPYGHPTKGTNNYSQPLLDKNGNIWDEWGCGQTILTIPEGEYKGTYTMWVSEEGRGYSGSSGQFYQKIMIAKMKSPWQLAGEPGIVTTPTQDWEYAGASSTHPRVVEGATPVYGKNGEIFVTYSGSGYWSDYGLGQLTWNGGDPLETSSWVKLPVANGNPIFTATTAENLRGAGHASFLTDTDGNGFICYHAYKYDYVFDEETQKWSETKIKASSRDAYIEPYYIDYSAWNGVSYGVIRLGLDGNGVAADTASTVTFATDGEYLSAPTITAKDGKAITLTMSESGAKGYLIYRSTDGEVFDYLTTVDATSYTDSNVTAPNTYYYRAYAYREEEIGDVSETVSATALNLVAPSITSVGYNCQRVNISYETDIEYTSYVIYRSENGGEYLQLAATAEKAYTDNTVSVGDSVSYKVMGIMGGSESELSGASDAVTIAHKEVSVDGLDATCTEAGYTAYSYCRYCEAPIITKEIIPATGHINTTTSTVDATCTETGSVTVTCACGEVVSIETVDAIGHSYEMSAEEIPATTTSVGTTAVYTCTSCGDSYGGEEIPKLEEEDVLTLSGDANGDGKVSLTDVLRTLKRSVGEEVDIRFANADTDGDSEITVKDVLAILMTVIEYKNQ